MASIHSRCRVRGEGATVRGSRQAKGKSAVSMTCGEPDWRRFIHAAACAASRNCTRQSVSERAKRDVKSTVIRVIRITVMGAAEEPKVKPHGDGRSPTMLHDRNRELRRCSVSNTTGSDSTSMRQSTARGSSLNAAELQTCRRSNAQTDSRILSPYARNRTQAQRIRTAVDAIDTERCAYRSVSSDDHTVQSRITLPLSPDSIAAKPFS